MSGLVEQLQADSLDQSVLVSTLLRKVKVAAVKLQLSDTVTWADNELKGYSDGVPPYRTVVGRSMARDHFGRWLPLGGAEQVLDVLRSRPMGQAISSLEDLKGAAGDSLMMPYSPRLLKALDLEEFEAAHFISRSSVVAIIDHVRNLVLDWALDLERAGIMGEGVTFSSSERMVAASSHINIHVDGPNARLNIASQDSSVNSNLLTDPGA